MRIKELLSNKTNNHIFPFMWVHGEEEKVYRETIRAIYGANIRAFCVEARPHENFGKKQWWDDMEVILDEAEKLGMKVWILDDKHFPTGYANGGMQHAPIELRKQNIVMKEIPVRNGKAVFQVKEEFFQNPSKRQYITDRDNHNHAAANVFLDDRFVSVTAIRLDAVESEPILLNDHVKNGIFEWEAKEGLWKVFLCYISRNTGTHRDYMNMMDKDSCHVLIEQVYEPHYEHFKDKFGTVIAGFFSDEPELGNGIMYRMYNLLGTDQDLPWSRELEKILQDKWGKDYLRFLCLLWSHECDEKLTAKVRYDYMDTVTRLVEEAFSKQIGTWCKEHGVEYTGHVIEDQNQHARTGTSLGHYFRSLKWQTMAGIDIIGQQIYPQGEDYGISGDPAYENDTEFYHYALCKMGSSLGELNPNMKGRTMCEIFGNYRWSEGVQLEKYLVDHCMVRGINWFVPHAFSCKAYPDPDCPPHFYAFGNDPLYRHFGELMNYVNRLTSLLEDGKIVTAAAILYHGEAEWTGQRMLMQKVGRILQDHQIDFHYVPCDIFEEPDFYHTEIGKELVVNGRSHQFFIVPYSQFIPEKTAEGIVNLIEKGCEVIFLEAFPKATCQGTKLPEKIYESKLLKLGNLYHYLCEKEANAVRILPENNRIRTMHFIGKEEVLYLFNESDFAYSGTVEIPWKGEVSRYDAWNNKIIPVEMKKGMAYVHMDPSESCILICEKIKTEDLNLWEVMESRRIEEYQIGYCRSIDYPNFKIEVRATTTGDFSKWHPDFSGFISYESTFTYAGQQKVVLEITEAHEGVEVFVNGYSVGIQIIPIYRFDLTKYCKPGENKLRIEVATTLERENENSRNAAPTGITGNVNLLFYQK